MPFEQTVGYTRSVTLELFLRIAAQNEECLTQLATRRIDMLLTDTGKTIERVVAKSTRPPAIRWDVLAAYDGVVGNIERCMDVLCISCPVESDT
jgi:hypothetical protein